MKIGINLASAPLRRDRPILIGSALVALLMAFSLIALIALAFVDRGAIREDRRVQRRLSQDLVKLQADQRKVDAQVRRPDNSEVLERSVLINELLLRKGISWTRIFADLEKVLPLNVRITQIRPQVTNNNRISLEMSVAADSPEPLGNLLAKIEDSDVFGSYNVTSSIAPTQTNPFFSLRMNVIYAQKF